MVLVWLAFYSAYLLEVWNILKMRHKSSIKYVVPKGNFASINNTFPETTEVNVKQVMSHMLHECCSTDDRFVCS